MFSMQSSSLFFRGGNHRTTSRFLFILLLCCETAICRPLLSSEQETNETPALTQITPTTTSSALAQNTPISNSSTILSSASTTSSASVSSEEAFTTALTKDPIHFVIVTKVVDRLGGDRKKSARQQNLQHQRQPQSDNVKHEYQPDKQYFPPTSTEQKQPVLVNEAVQVPSDHLSTFTSVSDLDLPIPSNAGIEYLPVPQSTVGSDGILEGNSSASASASPLENFPVGPIIAVAAGILVLISGFSYAIYKKRRNQATISMNSESEKAFSLGKYNEDYQNYRESYIGARSSYASSVSSPASSLNNNASDSFMHHACAQSVNNNSIDSRTLEFSQIGNNTVNSSFRGSVNENAGENRFSLTNEPVTLSCPISIASVPSYQSETNLSENRPDSCIAMEAQETDKRSSVQSWSSSVQNFLEQYNNENNSGSPHRDTFTTISTIHSEMVFTEPLTPNIFYSNLDNPNEFSAQSLLPPSYVKNALSVHNPMNLENGQQNHSLAAYSNDPSKMKSCCFSYPKSSVFKPSPLRDSFQ